jgi:hypothetical protein
MITAIMLSTVRKELYINSGPGSIADEEKEFKYLDECSQRIFSTVVNNSDISRDALMKTKMDDKVRYCN